EELQLAMVSWPMVNREALQGALRQEHRERTMAVRDCRRVQVVRCRGSREPGAHQRQKRSGTQRVRECEPDQVGQVLLSLAQRGDADPGRGVQPRIEIMTEPPFAVQARAVGCGS